MADHVATSTQALHPWRAAIRTAVEVGIPAFVGLLGILPFIIQDILDNFGEHLPPAMYAWLAGAALVITAVSATLAKIMARADAIAWTRDYLPWLAPDDKR